MPAKQVFSSSTPLVDHSAPAGGSLPAVPRPRSGRSPHMRVTWSTTEPSRTKQEFAAEADINVLMGRYLSTGVIPPAVRQGYFADVDAIDYQQALGLVHEATDLFNQLPSKVRERFGNNPAALMEFVADAGNRDEAISLGLIDAPRASLESRGGPDDPAPVPTPAGKAGGA